MAIRIYGGIILEGADQSGKTTLANQLSERLGMKIIHHAKPVGSVDWFDEYGREAKDEEKYIIDRSYMSEMVYGKLFRNTNNIIGITKVLIENAFRDGKYVLVLCHRKDFGAHNFEKRAEGFSFEQIMQARSEFYVRFNDINIPSIIVDPFKKNSNCVMEIINFMEDSYGNKQD